MLHKTCNSTIHDCQGGKGRQLLATITSGIPTDVGKYLWRLLFKFTATLFRTSTPAMGATISAVRAIVDTTWDAISTYAKVDANASRSPGIPIANASVPFWAIPRSPLASHGSTDPLPAEADVLVIGSGITGASFVREFLGSCDPSCSVVMLDAREVCYGATGRNGGHVCPPLYQDFDVMEKAFGKETTQEIMRFRRAHFPALKQVAQEEGLTDATVREVTMRDVFLEKSLYEEMLQKLDRYLDALPEEKGAFETVCGPDVAAQLGVSDRVWGAIATQGGAAHPYRLVTTILARLLKEYPKCVSSDLRPAIAILNCFTASRYSHTPPAQISSLLGTLTL